MRPLLCLLALAFVAASRAATIDFEAIGGVPDDTSYEAALANGNLMNKTFNSLLPGDTLFIANKTYTLIGGIKASGLINVTFVIDGTLSFSDDRSTWPLNDAGDHVMECIDLYSIENIVFTSSGKGTLNGNGQKWWGAIDFLKHQEDRPRLVHIHGSKNVLVENLLLLDSPFWTFWAENCDGMVVRHTDVSARWTDIDRHTLLDLQAFNTDGLDFTGRNVHVHDCNIWNQDDCIAVKDSSANMLFERISCSGLGLVIGSIGGSKVQNITFRDCVMPNTFKGIYLKTRWSDSGPVGDEASIEDVLYENITIESPEQWGIWIGPAQQTGQPCSLLWPHVERASCEMSGYQTWKNIVLRNVFINNPRGSPGVLLGNASNPMQGVVFDNVVVTGAAAEAEYHTCEGIQGYAMGGTSPVPPCFQVVN